VLFRSIAAGALLIEEAGGLVGDFSGGREFLDTGNIVAGNPQIYEKILPLIQAHMPVDLKR
jgi:myo-inositol-1(or 4)-monophosphatase